MEAATGRHLGDAVTSADGSFRVPGLSAGTHVVIVEMRQFDTARLDVVVAEADPAPLHVVLGVAGLAEAVSVQAPTLTRRSATAATRFEADVLSVPQSTQSLTSALIEAQGAIDVGDVLKQVPSAFVGHTRLASFTSFSWKIRGLDAGVTRNGFRQLYFEDVDQSAFLNVDRVEVIKGPGGAVSGKEGLGGIIHLVTKRPSRVFDANGYVTIGQYSTRAGGFDITGPLGDTGLAVRLNTEVERSGTFADFQDMNRRNVAFSASWDKQQPVRAVLNVEFQRRETLPNPGLPLAGTIRPNGVGTIPRSRYLGEPNVDFLDTWSPLVQAWIEIDVAKGWTLSPRYQRFTFNVDQQHLRLRAPSATDVTLVARNGRFDFHERDKTQTAQLELKGRATLGRTSHQMVAGYEVNRHSYTGDWSDYVGTPAIRVVSPSYLLAPPNRSATRTTFSGDINTQEPYLQDLIGWDRLDVLLGVRRSHIEIDSEFGGFLTEGQNHAGSAYQVGAAYRVAPSWSVFSGVNTGLSVDNIVGSTSADGTPFVPERSRQFEIGLKHLTGRLSGSASYFDIRFENATTADPANPDFSLQIGEQRSRGVEFEAAVQGGERWFMTGGLAFVDATITESNDGDVGHRLPNVSRVQANVWGRFAMHPRVLAGIGFNYVGKSFGTIANIYEVPSYGTLDASARWQVHPKLALELFGQNLLDEVYYTGANNFSVFPGEPRTVYMRVRASLASR